MIFLMSRPAYRSVFCVPQNTECITQAIARALARVINIILRPLAG
jgi:hypothetical protein